MEIQLVEESAANLAELALIPIAFQVDRVLDVAARDGGTGFVLTERRIASPYIKDYDAIEGNHPSRWGMRFDTSRWGWIGARSGDGRIGAAVIAVNAESSEAVLWDLRVLTEARGQGIGSTLFRAAEAWATSRGFRELRVETQNINVPACRFYERQGCGLW
jgi:ribosomal protein S18 acetylase RimI-like enzyme